MLGTQFQHLGFKFVQYGVVGLVDCRLALQHGDLLLLQLLLLEGLYGVVAVEAQQGTPGLDVRMQNLTKG